MHYIKHLTPLQLEKARRTLLSFVIRHGERRITKGATDWLAEVSAHTLNHDGNALLIATLNQRLAGILGVAQYGRTISFIVVAPKFRGIGLGENLMRSYIEWAQELTCRVYIANYPSLKTCLKAGLIANACWSDRKGKTILQFITPNLLMQTPLEAGVNNEHTKARDYDLIFK